MIIAMPALQARCVNCGAEELLSRIVEGVGACSFCQLSFCDDEAALVDFQRDVLRADVCYRVLIRSLRLLAEPSVHLRVLPEPLLAGLVTGVPWEEAPQPRTRGRFRDAPHRRRSIAQGAP